MAAPSTNPPTTSGRPTLPNASAVRSIAGIPAWGAVLVAVVLSALGVTVDALVSSVTPPVPSWGFRVGFVGGVALAALLVRRGSLFTALVQPPLVMVVVVFLALRLMSSERMTISLIKLVDLFPTMLVGTAVAVVLCVVRIFAQPLRHHRSSTATPQRAHV